MTTLSAFALTRPADTRDHDRGEDWTVRAACLAEDPDLFFPVEGVASQDRAVREAAWAPAREVCARCLVRDLCLDGAIERREPEGMFGGLTPKERRRLARRTERGQR